MEKLLSKVLTCDRNKPCLTTEDNIHPHDEKQFADNCNDMDILFSIVNSVFSRHHSSCCPFAGEQCWRSAL
ncbi:hypothetical protein GA0061070_10325 [Kosakonia oryziphila]|uniref:Uncharacterized protein n=1 Tax=Kosakonia oryziphila TaxID=1005667 RepID=A0A1C4F6D1_9ENTR|nr:hypothetical protein GA0061070_10325 [Kosakonia oryziphila]